MRARLAEVDRLDPRVGGDRVAASPSAKTAPLTSTVTRRAKLKTRSMSCSISSTDTSAGKRVDDVEDLLALAFGHAGDRLVEQQHARPAGERQSRSRAGGACRRAARRRAGPARRRGGTGAAAHRTPAPTRGVGAEPLPPAPRRCRAAARPLSASDCSGVSSPNSWLIWNVRTRPRRTRRCGARRVMSSPSSRIAPAVGSSMPVSRLIRVVLPAPFGPISAWRAPELDPERDVVGRHDAAEALHEAAGLEHDRRFAASPPAMSTAAAAGRGRPAPARPGTGRSRSSSTAASRPRAGRAAA